MNNTRLFAFALSFLLIFSSTFSQAGIVSAADVQHHYDKQTLLQALDKTEVQQKLTTMGVDVNQVKDRVDHLTSAELAQINQQMDEMPAGSGVLGALVLIFIVFVITDVIGATNIFPFIHPVN